MPEMLYKYRVWDNPHHKRLLTDMELFFPEPKKFNDPYDCGLPFRPDPQDSYPVKIKQKLEELAPRQFPNLIGNPKALEEEIAKQLFHILEDPDTYFQQQYGFNKDDLNLMYGVVSLTPHAANFLMWSHYADSHKGFVIGFDTKKLVKQNLGAVSKVKYSEEIPTVNVLEMDIHLMHRLIYTKAKIWEYEDEYRITRINGPNTKATVNSSALQTVHLGVNMPLTDKFAILEIVKNKYPNARVYEMTLGKEKFQLIPSHLF
jgi:hypothetical protein